ncbi:MAG: hypothetical protein REJ23_01655 [Brevundimonas sp.]|nr:hypothetical protein [Brevundimonas sp.]
MSALLLALLVQDVAVRAVEAPAASPWSETYTATCGADRIEVSRVVRPQGRPAVILINGVPARGDAAALSAALSGEGVAYRMSFQCQPGDQAFLIRWVGGRSVAGGEPLFTTGSALAHDGAIVDVRSEDTGRDAFWYR